MLVAVAALGEVRAAAPSRVTTGGVFVPVPPTLCEGRSARVIAPHCSADVVVKAGGFSMPAVVFIRLAIEKRAPLLF